MRLARGLRRTVALGVLAAVVAGAPASAHTGLDSSDPADGSAVEGPVETVVLEFTGTPTAIDDGIVVADGAGTRIEPVEVTQDGLRITARFEPPLTAGSYALSWVVRSDDTHTIDGSLAFSVLAPPGTTAPTSTIPTETTAPAAPTTVAAAPVATTVPPQVTTVAPAPADERAEPDAAVVAGGAPPAATPVPPVVTVDAEDGEGVARVGRLLFFPAAVVALGVLAFAALAFAGGRSELDSLFRLVRWLGVAVALGAVIEVTGLTMVFGGLGDLASHEAGRAALARIVAGVLLVVGFGTLTFRPRSQPQPQPLSAAVVESERAAPVATTDDGRWRPGAGEAAGLIGAAVLVVSFGFDGHTASEGPRLVHALSSIVHVVAASVWAGGLVALAVVLWLRHANGLAARAVEMVVRFSVVAMVALAVAGAAGVVMALFIQSDLGAYVRTDWGRLMLVKLALVLAAGALGAYNHFRLLPSLRVAPDDPGVVGHARSTVTVEAVLVVGAAVVTAVLVGASTI